MMESILGKFEDEFQEFSINFDKATINIFYYKKGLVLKSGALQVFFLLSEFSFMNIHDSHYSRGRRRLLLHRHLDIS